MRIDPRKRTQRARPVSVVHTARGACSGGPLLLQKLGKGALHVAADRVDVPLEPGRLRVLADDCVLHGFSLEIVCGNVEITQSRDGQRVPGVGSTVRPPTSAENKAAGPTSSKKHPRAPKSARILHKKVMGGKLIDDWAELAPKVVALLVRHRVEVAGTRARSHCGAGSTGRGRYSTERGVGGERGERERREGEERGRGERKGAREKASSSSRSCTSPSSTSSNSSPSAVCVVLFFSLVVFVCFTFALFFTVLRPTSPFFEFFDRLHHRPPSTTP